MKKNSETVEKRLENLKKVYNNIESIVDNIPEAVPKKIRKQIKDSILGDKDLKELMEGLENHRPPKIFFVGRTGVGKSSLINAMIGSYVANVDDVKSCTATTTPYNIMDGDRILMQVLDTRGFAESESLDEKETAESDLLIQVKAFCPDLVLFVLNSTHRDDIVEDISFLKKVCKDYEDLNKMKLPIVTVVNKCDEVQPGRFKNPKEYPESKIQTINNIVHSYKGIIYNNNLKIKEIIPVSSYIEWVTKDGMIIDSNKINCLTDSDKESLQINFDGRYNIDKLYHILDSAILDFEAQMGLRMAFRLNELVRKIAYHFTHIFAGISSAIAATAVIPISDIWILIVVQTILVLLIAALSGRDISFDSAKEFIFSAGGVGGAGFVFRLIGQQTVKLANFIFPGSGSVASAAVAAGGTEIVGHAAISYYIDEKTLDDVRKQVEKEKKEKEIENNT